MSAAATILAALAVPLAGGLGILLAGRVHENLREAVTLVTAVTLAASLSLLAVLALLLFLIQKEILSASTSERAQALSRVLDIAIVPLLLSFVFIAAVKVSQVLN